MITSYVGAEAADLLLEFGNRPRRIVNTDELSGFRPLSHVGVFAPGYWATPHAMGCQEGVGERDVDPTQEFGITSRVLAHLSAYRIHASDFSMHSADRRMWILDLIDGTLLWNLHVTHGENSSTGSEAYATSFSNINDSHQSSLGMMKAAELYTSSTVGPGLRLDGLEPGYNDNVRMRGIVVHGATYARAENVASWGVAGTSWGCPAVDDRLVDDVMDTLTGGGMMFFWYPDGDWSSSSGYLD